MNFFTQFIESVYVYNSVHSIAKEGNTDELQLFLIVSLSDTFNPSAITWDIPIPAVICVVTLLSAL